MGGRRQAERLARGRRRVRRRRLCQLRSDSEGHGNRPWRREGNDANSAAIHLHGIRSLRLHRAREGCPHADTAQRANPHVWKPPPSQPVPPALGATVPTGAGTGSSGTQRMTLLTSCTCARLRRLSPTAVNARRAQPTVVSGAHLRSCCDSGTDAPSAPPNRGQESSTPMAMRILWPECDEVARLL